MILNIFARGYDVPRDHELKVMLGAVVVEVFGGLRRRERCATKSSDCGVRPG